MVYVLSFENASPQGWWGFCRVVISSRLLVKIFTYLASIGQLICLEFLHGWRFLNKISLDWPLTLTTQPSTSKRSNNFWTLFLGFLRLQPRCKAAIEFFLKNLHGNKFWSPEERNAFALDHQHTTLTWLPWRHVQTSYRGGNEGSKAPILYFKDPA